jgi:hypothetical protein
MAIDAILFFVQTLFAHRFRYRFKKNKYMVILRLDRRIHETHTEAGNTDYLFLDPAIKSKDD